MAENDSADGTTAPPTKLTRTKQRWAEERRFLTGRVARPDGERLPPGQHLVRDWPILDLGLRPDISPESWSLTVDGLVESPLAMNRAGFAALPRTSSVSDIHCVTTWSRFDNRWDGVATLDLLDRVRPASDARFVVLHSYDGYTTNLALDDFADPAALLADGWDGRPLATEHGGPVRLVVPHLYFWKSAKWLKRIELVADNQPGFWEVRGYHDRGDPWREQRYAED